VDYYYDDYYSGISVIGPTNDVDITGLHYYYKMALLGQTRDGLLSNLFAGNARNKGKERQK